jgi:hypothetical protein
MVEGLRKTTKSNSTDSLCSHRGSDHEHSKRYRLQILHTFIEIMHHRDVMYVCESAYVSLCVKVRMYAGTNYVHSIPVAALCFPFT